MNSPSSSSSTTQHLSHLPNVRHVLEQNNRVAVWRLPSELSQSRLGGRTAASNACTLIALQLIELFERRNLHFEATHTAVRTPLAAAATFPLALRAPAGSETRPATTMCSRFLMGTFVEAILEGNEAHERAAKARKPNEQNFTVPDAITAMQRPLSEIDFCTITGSFTVQLPRYIRMALRSASLVSLDRIHFVIIAFERSVLMVADRRTNSLIVADSHLHGSLGAPTTGAVVAVARLSDLATLVQWMSEYIFPEVHSPNVRQEYEISTVSYTGTARDCVEELRGGFSAYRPPSVPIMGRMPIFIPLCDKENQPPGSCSNQSQSRKEPLPKKTTKRSADSQDPAPPTVSNSKRVRP